MSPSDAAFTFSGGLSPPSPFLSLRRRCGLRRLRLRVRGWDALEEPVRHALFLRPDVMEPPVLDALRRHETEFALVHVAVVVGIEPAAAVELEANEVGRRLVAELVRRLVARGRILHGAQRIVRE